MDTPTPPARLIELTARLRRAQAAVKRGVLRSGDYAAIYAEYREYVNTSAEVAAYNAEVGRYNSAILARRGRAKVAKQAATNQREAAQVRAQTCTSCFQVKSASGSCGC